MQYLNCTIFILELFHVPPINILYVSISFVLETHELFYNGNVRLYLKQLQESVPLKITDTLLSPWFLISIFLSSFVGDMVYTIHSLLVS